MYNIMTNQNKDIEHLIEEISEVNPDSFIADFFINHDSIEYELRTTELPGVPKNTIHCLISCNVNSIKAISLK